MITIRDFAKASGFSPTTISLVLNNSPAGQHIPEKTRDQIRKWARKLDYYPNQFARSLRSSRSGAVAVLVPDVSDPYCAQVLLGIDKSLYGSSYLPVLIDVQNSRARFRKYVATFSSGALRASSRLRTPCNCRRRCCAQYSKGTCPVADDFFERSILLAIPSFLSEADENDIIHALRKVFAH
jgi:Bacterial regulatory proteins, lacI family